MFKQKFVFVISDEAHNLLVKHQKKRKDYIFFLQTYVFPDSWQVG